MTILCQPFQRLYCNLLDILGIVDIFDLLPGPPKFIEWHILHLLFMSHISMMFITSGQLHNTKDIIEVVRYRSLCCDMVM